MKKTAKLPVILIIALTAFFAVSFFGMNAANSVYAAPRYETYDDPYSYFFEDFSVVYDFDEERIAKVTETFSVHFTGRESTGIIKDIPVNAGEQVRNVGVKELTGGVLTEVDYSVYFEDSGFLSVDIGDYTNKTNKICTYVVTYDYFLSVGKGEENAIFLNAIGLGRENKGAVIKNASVTIIAPAGFKSAVCLAGSYNDGREEAMREFTTDTLDNGKTRLTVSGLSLDGDEGVTFEMNFENGALSSFSDYIPYLFALAAGVILAVLIILRLFAFNKDGLMPVVNYEAPDKMDPLLMGKLIDNKVNGEDVTSLIYYWASKGYLKINLDNKNDPSIIRVMRSLPEPCADYERIMYDSLFSYGEIVRPSVLENRFYKTVEKVSSVVNRRTAGLYNGVSFGVAALFAVLSGILLGLAPLILGFVNVSSKLFYLAGFLFVVPSVLVFIVTLYIMYNKLKFSKRITLLLCIGTAALCAVIGVLYVLLIPTALLSVGAKITLFAVCALISSLAVTIVMRTEKYTQNLNDIIGFKNFIMLAEKDQLEMMLEDDPQFYYRVLPYAQVLGVTDKWTDKFKDLTVEPPKWLTGDVVTTYFEFRIINGIIASSMSQISQKMISRPAPKGGSGGGRGGFGGGHVGGGHGGGGFRGR